MQLGTGILVIRLLVLATVSSVFMDGVMQGRPAEAQKASFVPSRLSDSTLPLLAPHNRSRRNAAISPMVSAKGREMRGYDCTTPLQMTRVSNDHTQFEPCKELSKPLTQEPAEFVILQQTSFRRLEAVRCHVVVNTQGHYCGDHDHQTAVPSLTQFDVLRPPTVAECRRMAETQEYEINGQTHVVKMGATTHLRSDRFGHYDYHSASDVQCEGEAVQLPDGTVKHDINVVDYYAVTLTREEIKADPEGRIHLGPRDDFSTSCSAAHGSCRTHSVTHVWSPSGGKESCMHYQLRRTKGILVTGENDVQTYISTDETMIRLIKKDATFLCGQRAFKTNFEMLHMIRTEDALHFPDDLPLGEISFVTYANQQDNFLHGYLTDYVVREFLAIQQEDCQRQQHQIRGTSGAVSAAAQRAAADGQTWHLGNGEFSTSSGEIWHNYVCRPIVVMARDAEHCYDALPVDLSQVDQVRFEKIFGETPHGNAEPVYFLEPHSRRIRRFAARIPCSSLFPPSWVNLENNWIDVTPTLRNAKTPEAPLDDWVNRVVTKPKDLDFEKGGIYPPDVILAAERYSQMPRNAEEAGVIIGIQANRSAAFGQGHVSPHDIFEEMPDVDYQLFAEFWEFIDHFGRVLTVFMFCFLVCKVMTFLFGLFYRCATVHRIFGFSCRLFTALMPSVMDYILTSLGVQIRGRDDAIVVRQQPETAVRQQPEPSAPPARDEAVPLYPTLRNQTGHQDVAVAPAPTAGNGDPAV